MLLSQPHFYFISHGCVCEWFYFIQRVKKREILSAFFIDGEWLIVKLNPIAINPLSAGLKWVHKTPCIKIP